MARRITRSPAKGLEAFGGTAFASLAISDPSLVRPSDHAAANG